MIMPSYDWMEVLFTATRSRPELFADIGLPPGKITAPTVDDDPRVRCVTRTLTGIDPDIAAIMAADAAPSLAPVFGALVAHAGLDPRAVAVFTHRLESLVLYDYGADDFFCRIQHGGRRRDWLIIPGLGTWGGTGIITIADRFPMTFMPDTLSGRALREVVAHPVLDRYELEIIRAHVDTKGRLVLSLAGPAI